MVYLIKITRWLALPQGIGDEPLRMTQTGHRESSENGLTGTIPRYTRGASRRAISRTRFWLLFFVFRTISASGLAFLKVQPRSPGLSADTSKTFKSSISQRKGGPPKRQIIVSVRPNDPIGDRGHHIRNMLATREFGSLFCYYFSSTFVVCLISSSSSLVLVNLPGAHERIVD